MSDAEEIRCPVCGKRQFSIVDKRFVKKFNKCIDCTSRAEIDALTPDEVHLLTTERGDDDA